MSNPSRSVDSGLVKRELMTRDELLRMNNEYCIVFLKGHRPVYDRKFQIFDSSAYKEAKGLGLYRS